ncbi:MAG: ferritin family protein [Candidatus Omnitrophota bacterium]
MLPIEALKLALSKETEAIILYNKLSLEYPGLKDVFSFLVNQEEKHRQLLEKRIYEMTK